MRLTLTQNTEGVVIVAEAEPQEASRSIASLELLVNGRQITPLLVRDVPRNVGGGALTPGGRRVTAFASFKTYGAPSSLTVVAKAIDSAGLHSQAEQSLAAPGGSPDLVSERTPFHISGKGRMVAFGASHFAFAEQNLPKGASSAQRMAELFGALPGFTASARVDARATRQGVLEGLKAEVEALHDGDLFISYLGMHGTTSAPNVFYLLPETGNTIRLEETALDWQEIVTLLKQAREKGAYVLVLLDACHSGFAVQNPLSVGNQRLATVLKTAGIAVISACEGGRDDYAWDPVAGRFSYFVEGWEAAFQSFSGKSVPLEKLFDRMQEEVKLRACSAGHEQVPQYFVPAEAPEVKRIELNCAYPAPKP